MAISFDGEARGTGWTEVHGKRVKLQRYGTMSYGRADGTSGSCTAASIPEMLKWALGIVNANEGVYVSPVDGRSYRQVPVAFHFGWDTDTMLKELDENRMFIVRKVQVRLQTALCGSTHPEGTKCPMEVDLWENPTTPDGNELRTGVSRDDDGNLVINVRHRYKLEDVKWVLEEGGDSDLAAFDPKTKLAIASTRARRFYVEHRPNGDRYEEWQKLDIHDTGSSFVGGLESVIDTWRPEISEEQREIIRWGKANRGEDGFDEAPIEKLCEYSEAECVAHAKVVHQLLDCIRDSAHVQIPVDKLYGSGSVAGSVMRHYGVPTKNETHHCRDEVQASPEMLVDDLPLMTYFGGMIETPVVGLVKGDVDEVDINSAYPAVLVTLPCMRSEHGTWRQKSLTQAEVEDLASKTVGHALVTWDITDRTSSTPPFMVRGENMCVYQPWRGIRVWVTIPELVAAWERFGDDVVCHSVVWWDEACDCREPFWWLADMYSYRQNLKRQIKERKHHLPEWVSLDARLDSMEMDDPQYRVLEKRMKEILKDDPDCLKWFREEQAIKLIINSIYGKCAEHRRGFGKYTNLHYAAMITGHTRAKLRRMTWLREREGGRVVYQHTDAVLSQGGNPVDEGPALGAFGLEDKRTTDFLILQPGLAVGIEGGKRATRGCGEKEYLAAAEKWLAENDLTEHPLRWKEIEVTQNRMISRRQAEMWGRPELAGSFVPHTMRVKPSRTKRDLEAAVPYSAANPEAWVVPPREFVDDTADIHIVREAKKMSRRELIDLVEESHRGTPEAEEVSPSGRNVQPEVNESTPSSGRLRRLLDRASQRVRTLHVLRRESPDDGGTQRSPR